MFLVLCQVYPISHSFSAVLETGFLYLASTEPILLLEASKQGTFTLHSYAQMNNF